MTIQMDAIASASSASWYHSGTPKLSCKQCLCIYKAPCFARACWTQPKPVVLHRADAGFAFFQNVLSALRRSAQPSRAVMFTGIGIVSQQPKKHEILCLVLFLLPDGAISLVQFLAHLLPNLITPPMLYSFCRAYEKAGIFLAFIILQTDD